jgi:hypothetical protein
VAHVSQFVESGVSGKAGRRAAVVKEGRYDMDKCVVCGTDVDRGGYSTTKIPGVILRPLCLNCRELCDKDPKRFADEHRGLFERMLADRRERLAAMPAPVDTVSAESHLSPRERTLVGRYGDAYLLSRAMVAIGNAVKVIGVVLAVLIVAGTFIFTSHGRGDASLFQLLIGLVPATLVGMVCYALGTLVAEAGQILKATLDIAVNTSPFLSNDLRAETMAI